MLVDQQLVTHLTAIRRFVLLSSGEFAHALSDSIAAVHRQTAPANAPRRAFVGDKSPTAVLRTALAAARMVCADVDFSVDCFLFS
jgi:hypothetical protein